MKSSALVAALFGVLVASSQAAKTSHLSEPESRTDLTRAQERGDKGGHGGHGGGGGGHGGGGGGHGGHGGGGQGGGSGGGGGGHSEGHGQAVYHETYGQELFQGEEWMLLIPLVLIPLVVLGCWYFMGGKGGDEGWGWDRMGYGGDNSVGGGYQQSANGGAYESRSFSPANAMDKTTHQRIMTSIRH